MIWLEEAKGLPANGRVYMPHEDCSERKTLWVYNDSNSWGCFCNKCGYKKRVYKGLLNIKEVFNNPEIEEITYDVQLPEGMIYNVEDFPLEAKVWLYKGDIRNIDIKNHKIGFSKYLNRVVLSMYSDNGRLITWQARAIFKGQSPKYINQESIDKSKHLFKPYLNCNNSYLCKDLCIVTEDILSSIRVNKLVRSESSLGTTISDYQALSLSKYNNVGIWYDPDRGGEEGAAKAYKKLSLYTSTFIIRSEEDPKNLSNKQIMEIINERYHLVASDEDKRKFRII